MSTSKLIRWTGLASIMSGMLYALGALLHPIGETLTALQHPRWIPSHLVYWVSIVLLHFALIGLYAVQSRETGWMGLISFVLALIGTSFVASLVLVVSTTLPLVAANAPDLVPQALTPPDFLIPVFLLGFGLGYVLFGVATMRAAVLPRWSGLPMIIGVLLFVISEAGVFDPVVSHWLVTVGDILFGSALVWMGFALWTNRQSQTPLQTET